jgi:hypothetical protein
VALRHLRRASCLRCFIEPVISRKKKGPLALASGPSLGRKRPRRAAIAQALPHRNNMPMQRKKRKRFSEIFHALCAWVAPRNSRSFINLSSDINDIAESRASTAILRVNLKSVYLAFVNDLFPTLWESQADSASAAG